MIPAALGTVVTGVGIKLRSLNPTLGWGVAGFGLAHILLGGIDLAQNRYQLGEIVSISDVPDELDELSDEMPNQEIY
ncbi:hypothetical protein BX659_11414 [Orenia metallireducens]|jgi:hypothetical protein|uniref:Asparagine synthase n=1 Tax=Orenia metallireducens TaxID=1413210 RepID=A0A285HS92_9FIRM|nr:hypothetical protein [Orenia metallireducens]PRX27964.1 hypothetical protein BX659_11414 [Orenia metallireducens]SNY37601.1 hypothetical protein SAMN06265827_12245 [Orenia metallireducens]